MASADQPTAPYLDAVIAYGFRGSTRFHVPGHKAGNGADLGVRTAIGWQTLKLDIPQDIHGVDLGESPTPYAARGAARRRGVRRGALVVSDQRRHPGQPRVVPGAGAAGRARGRAAQRARVRDRRARALGRAADVGGAASTSPSSAWRTASRRTRCEPRWRRRRARAPRSSSPPPTTGWRPTSRAAPRSRTRPACRWWSTSRGARTSASTATCRRARCRIGADAMLTSVHKIAGSLTQSALLHVSGSGRIDPDAVARTLRLMRSTSPSSLLMLSLDGARRQLVLHGEAILSTTIAASRRTAAAIDRDPRLPRRRRRGDRPARRRRPRPAADRHRRPRHRRDRLRHGRVAAVELRHAGRARHPGHDRARARHRRAAARARAVHPRPDVDRLADGAAGRDRGGHAAVRARSRTRS